MIFNVNKCASVSYDLIIAMQISSKFFLMCKINFNQSLADNNDAAHLKLKKKLAWN